MVLPRRASVNSHNWYGIIANFKTELNENLVLDFGIDLRNYKGFHYRRVNDLLGGRCLSSKLTTDNNPYRRRRNIYTL